MPRGPSPQVGAPLAHYVLHYFPCNRSAGGTPWAMQRYLWTPWIVLGMNGARETFAPGVSPSGDVILQNTPKESDT